MKKYILMLIFLLTYSLVFSAPSNTMSISPTATDGTTIEADDENSRNNVITTTYNAHTHTDISQVGNTLNVGDALAGNKTINAYNADTNKPYLKYDDTNDYWVFSTNGVAPSIALQDEGLIFEGATDDTYETTITITDPTADRTFTIPNNTGTVVLTGASSAQTLDFSSDTISNLGTVTTANIDGGTIDGVTITGSNFDINGGTIDGVTIGGTSAPTVTDLGIVTTVDINGGTIDGVQIGGTTATGELIVNDSSDYADGLGSQGTSGQFLQSQGAGFNPTWADNTNTSNVVFQWVGIYDGAANQSGLEVTTATSDSTPTGNHMFLNVLGTTVRTVLRSKFKKIVGINTLTPYVFLSDNVLGSGTVTLDINAGAVTDTVTSNNTTPNWQNGSGADVSGLTDGTVYDLLIKMNSDEVTGTCEVFSIIIFGS